MRKLMLMIVFGGIIVITSCSKKSDYMCACDAVYSIDGSVFNTESSSYTYTDQKEEDAEELCSGNEYSISTSFGGNSTSDVKTCTLTES